MEIFHIFEKAVEELKRGATYLSISMTEFSLPLQRDMQGDDPANRSLPSSKNPHFQNEAKCTTKMRLICIRMKNHFHIRGCALHLVLIQRLTGTREWPICTSRYESPL